MNKNSTDFKNITFELNFINAIKSIDSEFTKKDYPKLEQAIHVHGYRGPSKKKHNGVVIIKPDDINIKKNFDKLLEISTIGKNISKINGAIPVKVVAHVENIRLVGIRFPDLDESHFNLHIIGACGYDGSMPFKINTLSSMK